MSDYADLKARLDRWKLVWGDLPSIAPHSATAPGMTTGGVIMDTQEAAAAIDALEGKCADLIAADRDHAAATAGMKRRLEARAEAAEARVKRLEDALRGLANKLSCTDARGRHIAHSILETIG
jgi:hypothetical protein